MSKLPVVQAKEVLKALRKDGFYFSFQSGSHATFKHPVTQHRVTVPLHRGKDLKKGTLRQIVRQAGWTVKQFSQLIK